MSGIMHLSTGCLYIEADSQGGHLSRRVRFMMHDTYALRDVQRLSPSAAGIGALNVVKTKQQGKTASY